MMNIGAGEVLLIAVLALLIFGPRRLPEIGKQAAKALREFRRAANELKSDLKSGLDERPDDSEKVENKESRPGPRG